MREIATGQHGEDDADRRRRCPVAIPHRSDVSPMPSRTPPLRQPAFGWPGSVLLQAGAFDHLGPAGQLGADEGIGSSGASSWSDRGRVAAAVAHRISDVRADDLRELAVETFEDRLRRSGRRKDRRSSNRSRRRGRPRACVGASGNRLERLPVVEARTRILPASTCGRAPTVSVNIDRQPPARKSVVASTWPL